MRRFILLSLGLLTLWPVSLRAGWGYPSSLNVVPTAYTLQMGQASLQLESDSSRWPLDGFSDHSLYTQFGITARLEVGADVYSIGQESTVNWNTKYAILRESGWLPSAGIGLWSVGSHSRAEPYLIASHEVGSLSVHLGGAWPGRRWDLLGGACLSVAERWSVQADYRGGPEGFATLGASFTPTESSCLTLYHSRATDREADADFTGLNLAWQFGLFR